MSIANRESITCRNRVAFSIRFGRVFFSPPYRDFQWLFEFLAMNKSNAYHEKKKRNNFFHSRNQRAINL